MAAFSVWGSAEGGAGTPSPGYEAAQGSKLLQFHSPKDAQRRAQEAAVPPGPASVCPVISTAPLSLP